MRDSVLELEVDNDLDRHLHFPPAGCAVRGRLDFLRLARRDPNAIQLTVPFPRGVPGQRIRVDMAAGQCSIVEGLHDADCERERKELAKRSIPIPEAVEAYPAAKVPDWLWAAKRAVDAGIARVVKGSFPDDLGEETVRPVAKDPGEDRIDRLCDLVERLLTRLVPEGA